MKKISLLTVLLTILFVASCPSAFSKSKAPKEPIVTNVKLELLPKVQIKKYVDATKAITVKVIDEREDPSYFHSFTIGSKKKPQVYDVRTYQQIPDFIEESVGRYMSDLGFNVYNAEESEYTIIFAVLDFGFSPEVYPTTTVRFNVHVLNSSMQEVYSTMVISQANSKKASSYPEKINVAYKDALEDIDWDRVASFVREPKYARAAIETQKVAGTGTTVLESTILRWYVESNPRGSDVYWRVVSSTPDVKNTNQSYLGTTPYESTETFDIKGLSYENSGDVQIEVSCEKVGYLTQRRRFNVRQAIDQKEISTKFNLVPEDE